MKKRNMRALPPQNTMFPVYRKNYLLIICLLQHNKTQQKSKSIKKKNLYYSNCRHLIEKIIHITQVKAHNSPCSLVWWLNHIKTTPVTQDLVSVQYVDPLDFQSRLSASILPFLMRFTSSFTHSTTSRTNRTPQTWGKPGGRLVWILLVYWGLYWLTNDCGIWSLKGCINNSLLHCSHLSVNYRGMQLCISIYHSFHKSQSKINMHTDSQCRKPIPKQLSPNSFGRGTGVKSCSAWPYFISLSFYFF